MYQGAIRLHLGGLSGGETASDVQCLVRSVYKTQENQFNGAPGRRNLPLWRTGEAVFLCGSLLLKTQWDQAVFPHFPDGVPNIAGVDNTCLEPAAEAGGCVRIRAAWPARINRCLWSRRGLHSALQRRPALEAVVHREGVLRFSESESGGQDGFVGLIGETMEQAQRPAGGLFPLMVRLQKVLGLMLELHEVRLGRKRAGHDDLLSRIARGSAIAGRKKVELISDLMVNLVLSADLEAPLMRLCEILSAVPPDVKRRFSYVAERAPLPIRPAPLEIRPPRLYLDSQRDGPELRDFCKRETS
jgi:hypothetical protein